MYVRKPGPSHLDPSHEERLRLYKERFANGLDPLTGRRLTKRELESCHAALAKDGTEKVRIDS